MGPRLAMSSIAKHKPRWIQSRLGLAGLHFAALVVCFTILRLVLFFSFRPSATVSEYLRAFGVGLHLDVTVALLMTLPLVFWFALLPHRLLRSWPHRIFFWFA